MDKKKLSLIAFVLMILTSVFGVTNIGTGFFRMGYAAMPAFIIGGLFFFIPFIFMMIEFGTGFKGSKGGMYVWMEKSINPKFAFIGLMMWYSSYVIWMFGKALSMWIPLSFLLFGKDVTVNKVMVGKVDFMPTILGVIGIIFVFAISKLIVKGPSRFAKISSIGGIAVIGLNVILIFGGIIVFVMNGFHLSQTISLHSFVSSPNPDYQSIVPFLGFLVFAVFAYGGVEAMAGVSDDLKNPGKDLKKGILMAGIFIVVCYVIGFLMVGAIMQWSQFPPKVDSLSALFLIMQNLGNVIGGSGLGNFFARLAGLGMFSCYLGAFIALSYAPLSQLIGGTPKEFWPESFQKKNENGISLDAVKMQTIIVIAFVALKSIFSLINPGGAQALFELILSMTNVGMTLPYVFLILAWYSYRKNENLKKDIVIFKSKGSLLPITIVTFTIVMFGNVFTIISPFISNDISDGVWTIIGPIVFSLIAIVIYNKALNKYGIDALKHNDPISSIEISSIEISSIDENL